MGETDASCRICRGESTPEQPLLHPCKCRGSIKFIHQECLMEWLSHQSKRDKKCDICDTPYRFVTIYDSEMPLLMPLGEIVSRMVILVGKTLFRVLSFVIFALCAAQVPLFWKFVSRMFSYAVDGKVSVPHFTARQVLLYGAYTTHSTSGKLLSDENVTFSERAETFIYNTYLPGLIQVIGFVLVLFVVFIEHEWVVREEGYTKLLLRRIGREPRTKLADLLDLMREHRGLLHPTEQDPRPPVVQNGNEAEPAAPVHVPDESQINRAIEDLRHFQAQGANDSPLHRALDRFEHRNLIQREIDLNGAIDTLNNVRDDQDDVNNIDLTANDSSFADFQGFADNHNNQGRDPDNENENEQNTNDEEQTSDPEVANANLDPDIHDSEWSESDEEPNVQHQQQRPEPANRPGLFEPDFADETAEELERRQNLVEDEMLAAEAANENLFDVLGFRFNLITPIQLMIIADVFVFLFLFCAYLVPHTVGNLFFSIYAFLLKSCGQFFTAHNLSTRVVAAIHTKLSLILFAAANKIPYLFLIWEVLSVLVFTPIYTGFCNAMNTERVDPPSDWERGVYLTIGWVFICDTVNKYMRNLVSGEKPVVGTLRKIYKVLFRIVATAKVFAIFGIEIVVFPIYCGFLLDVCLAPLFVDQFIVKTSTEVAYYFLLTTSRELQFNGYLRAVSYWGMGTCYMFLIALFVSMVRSQILRRGVLYFIKSPEDPNARLIHDAIVKPFKLQILRIFLSARVYLTLILGGIGLVTWAIRFLVNSPTGAEKGALLPIKFPQFIGFWLLVFLVFSLVESRHVLINPCKQFWQTSFAILCHKLRLSHFILDKPVPQERGYVVYRNYFYKVLQIGVPDFSKPVSYQETRAIFDGNPSVLACFVPDGSYIRAPSSDDNSRSFLRLMFIPVTKSDQPIALNGEKQDKKNEDDEDVDWWDADITYEDSYAVIYSPPYLRLRCFYLVCGICLFGALLTIILVTSSLILGTLIDLTLYKLIVILRIPIYEHDFRFANLRSILMGARIIVGCVSLYLRRPTLAEARDNVAAWFNRRPQPPFNLNNLRSLILIVSSDLLMLSQLHFVVMPNIEQYFFGLRFLSFQDSSISITPTWAGVLLQLAVTPGTLLPLMSHMKSLAVPGQQAWNSTRVRVQLVSLFMIHVPLVVFILRLYSIITDERVIISSQIVTAEVVVFLSVFVHIRDIVKSITEQIKNEKYVRGTAVENMPVEDDI